MFILYDLFFAVFVLFYLPVYFFKGKFHSGFKMRLGIFSPELKARLKSGPNIWVHAVSVGEAQTCRYLIEGLRKLYPDKRIIISTVTPTGNKIANSVKGSQDTVIYLPFDFSFIVRYVVNLINPQVMIIAETELWPNLINCLSRRNVPVIIVNARISDRSFPRYKFLKFLLKPIFNKINLFCAQTDTDAQRLIALGVHKDRVKVSGNMKYDYTDFKNDYIDVKASLGLKEGEKLFIAASTHPGEEEIILESYKKLLGEFPGLRLLIAPRHPERAEEIEKLVVKYGFSALMVSHLAGESIDELNRQTVFILDIIGQLVPFYAASDIVFVGGSLVKKGGHNILEPACFAKPIISGPWTFNFRDMTGLYLANKAILKAKDAEGLKEAVKFLLNDPQEAAKLGVRAKELLVKNRGATQKNLLDIAQIINERIST